MKVLHLINYAGKGGSEKYILMLIKNMINKDCDFLVAYSIDGDLINELKGINIDTIKLEMKHPFDIKAALKFKKICEERNVEVVHTHFLRENYISILAKIFGAKIKIVNTRHMLNNNGKIVSYVNKMLSIFNNNFIAVSNAVKNELVKEGIVQRKIKLIYTGVDIDYWKENYRSTIREEFHVDKEEFLITYIGRFSPEKGHGFLLQTIKNFNEINNKETNKRRVKFMLVGDGQLFESFKRDTSNEECYDNVVFTGYRKDIKNILLGSDLYISPSESEAFGISVIEALASGLPVIATNIGGHKEILSHRECGELIDYGDVDKNAAAIMKLLYDEEIYESYKVNAVKVIEENFSLSEMISETYEVYNAHSVK